MQKRAVFFSFSLLTLVWMLSLLTGCAWFEPKKEKSAEELASEGMRCFDKKDYKDAIESFEKLKDWYPFSKFAILAELKTADSHYYLQEYAEAIAGYEEFENLHPRNEAVPYVIYQIGQCYFEQTDTIDRDQTSARKALDTFSRLLRDFPEDVYAGKAAEPIRKCKRNLAEHELYVGRFYYKSKQYKAALRRFENVLSIIADDAPDRESREIRQDAQKYISECKKAGVTE